MKPTPMWHGAIAAILLAGGGMAHAVGREQAQVELAQATTAVQAAERDDAARYAAADLDEAHAMLDSARGAVESRDWRRTALYAERAKVCGELASAVSRQKRAEAAADEIRRSVDALRAQAGRGGAP